MTGVKVSKHADLYAYIYSMAQALGLPQLSPETSVAHMSCHGERCLETS